MTPVQMFRDRWECGHIGTVIFAVQAVLLVPYIIIAVMGGGTTLRAVSNGVVPFWLGGAIVSLGRHGLRVPRRHARHGLGQRVADGRCSCCSARSPWSSSARGMGGFRDAMEALLASPATAPLLTRERVSPLYFFSYTFIPLSSIAFPHIGIFCLTAQRRRATSGRPIVLYPICMLLDLAAVGVSRRRRQPGDGRAGHRSEARGARAARGAERRR